MSELWFSTYDNYILARDRCTGWEIRHIFSALFQGRGQYSNTQFLQLGSVLHWELIGNCAFNMGFRFQIRGFVLKLERLICQH